MRAAFALFFLVTLAGALLSSHQHKPFPLLIDEAHAVTIVCNPVFTPGIPKNRKVQRV